MEETTIKFDTAVLAKEKGWDGDFVESNKILTTQSLLQKWLREKHKLFVEPYRIKSETFVRIHQYKPLEWGTIYDNKDRGFDHCTIKEEEALEDGLLEALKLIPIIK